MALKPPMRKRRSEAVTLPAPVGGLNGRDGYPDMPPTDAFVMDNWFPGGTSVDTRSGSMDYVTGITSAVESLEVFAANDPTSSSVPSKLLAFAGGNIYDVSNAGPVSAPLMTGRASNRITSVMFGNAGGLRLMLYSGADQPLMYDGTTLTPLVITGVTGSPNTLHSPMSYAGRLYMAQTGQLGFYYLDVGAVQGVAHYYDLSEWCQKGGYLLTMTTYSYELRDGSTTDYALFITSEGEYIMYYGYDPSDPNNWQLAARYIGSVPIGLKGVFKFRGDIYLVTETGILTFSQIRQLGIDNENQQFLTAKLARLYYDYTPYRSTYGWQVVIYPNGPYLLVNIPTSSVISGPYIQYVMNTNTDAWCRFTGWDSICWALFNRNIYFGTYDGCITLANTGDADNGTPITANCRQAWNEFPDGSPLDGFDKHWHFATLVMQSDGTPPVSMSINVNYQDDPPIPINAPVFNPGAVWDVATWDVDYWAGTGQPQNLMVPVGKLGYTLSPWILGVTLGTGLRWYATRLVFEKTQGILVA